MQTHTTHESGVTFTTYLCYIDMGSRFEPDVDNETVPATNVTTQPCRHEDYKCADTDNRVNMRTINVLILTIVST